MTESKRSASLFSKAAAVTFLLLSGLMVSLSLLGVDPFRRNAFALLALIPCCVWAIGQLSKSTPKT